MKENFKSEDPKQNEGDKVVNKAIGLANINFDTSELQKEYYENKFPDNKNNPNNEKEEMEREDSEVIERTSSSSDELGKILSQLSEQHKKQFPELVAQIRDLSDKYYLLEKRFKDEIALLDEINSLHDTLENIKGGDKDIYRKEKETLYNEKRVQFTRSMQGDTHTEFEKMLDIKKELIDKELELKKNLKDFDNTSAWEN